MKLIIKINIEMPKVTPKAATTVCLGLDNRCVLAIWNIRERFIRG
jgi:hypothetical protein